MNSPHFANADRCTLFMKKSLLYFALLTIFSCDFESQETDIAARKINGELLYKTNCANCHRIDTDYTGPSLVHSFNRRSKDWVYDFLTNRNNVQIDSTHEKLKREFEYDCKEFPELSQDEVTAIYDYCLFVDQ